MMMRSLFPFLSRYDKNTIRSSGLLACWFAGSSLGLWAVRFCGDAYASFLQPLTGVLPEIGGVNAAAVFPLLLSACAVILFGDLGCFVLCLLRSVSQGFLLGLIGMVYGSAGALVAFLLGFSTLMTNAVLLYFWLRRLALGRAWFREDLAVCFGLCAGIGVADYLVIAPFLADVMNL